MSQIPLRFGTDEQFARVKELFTEAGFDDAGFLTGSAKPDAEETFAPYSEENRVPEGAGPAEVCHGLFLRAASVGTAHLARCCGPAAVENLSALGMIEPEGPDRVAATVRVRPMFGLHVVSDLWARGESDEVADDIVYPPDIGNTARYLSFIPTTACGRFLEACGGSGVAALLAASRFAQQAWSYDITERSTRFAEFSGRLNHLPNFGAGRGDTYEPAGDATFDRIVAHPPYVPVLQPTWIYHGGGVDGEAITRKLVEGLPRHLAPGGRFLCRCVGTDRDGQPFEQRIRAWLGASEAEFDVALYAIEAINPIYYITVSVLRGRSGRSDLPKWHKAFQDAKILRFVSCFFVVQRRAEKRDVFTVRRDEGPNAGPRELEWLVQWETLRHTPGIADRVLDTPLTPSSALSLRGTHEIREGKWEMTGQVLSLQHPFRISWPVEPWAGFLLPRSHGLTGRQLHRLLVEEEVIHPDVTATEFAAALMEMVSGGFLHMRGFEPPVPRA